MSIEKRIREIDANYKKQLREVIEGHLLAEFKKVFGEDGPVKNISITGTNSYNDNFYVTVIGDDSETLLINGKSWDDSSIDEKGNDLSDEELEKVDELYDKASEIFNEISSESFVSVYGKEFILVLTASSVKIE